MDPVSGFVSVWQTGTKLLLSRFLCAQPRGVSYSSLTIGAGVRHCT